MVSNDKLMKTAWFFGDSFVYGWGCRDKTNDTDKIMSQIVSEELGCKEINLANFGYSSDNIINSLISNINKIKKDDYVIIFDTYSARGQMVEGGLDYYTSWPEGCYFELPNEVSAKYFAIRNSIAPQLYKYYKSMYENLVTHLNSIGVHSFYFPCNNNWWEDKNFDLNLEKDGGHWSFKGHRQVASWVLSTINGKKII